MTLREKIEQLIAGLRASNDFEDEFYLTYTGQIEDGDISDWHNNHFEDNVELGAGVGETIAAAQFIDMLTQILESE